MNLKKVFFYLIPLVFIVIILRILAFFLIKDYKQWLATLVNYKMVVEDPAYKDPEFPLLNKDQILNLGHARTDVPDDISGYFSKLEYSLPASFKPYHSWYGAHKKHKEKGIIRIGIFGCSMVMGHEVAIGFDFPAFLQNNFINAGFDNVEVINFGVAGYGIHQSYLLWEYLGKEYDLDYVMFNPYTLLTDRDRSFKFRNFYFPIHARFIIKDEKLKLLPVIGETRKEASEIYFNLFQPWQYIRYDTRKPNFIKPFLPGYYRSSCNPFYYRSGCSWQKEILQTYAYIFRELSKKVKNLIIIANDDGIRNLKNDVEAPNVYFFDTDLESYIYNGLNSLFWAPHGHLSALGNKLRADELYSLFTGKNNQAKVIELADLAIDQVSADKISDNVPLYKYKDISFKIMQYPFSELRSYWYPSRNEIVTLFDSFKSKIYNIIIKSYFDNVNSKEVDGKTDFQKEKIHSLLDITKNFSVLEFLKLNFLLENDSTIYFSFTSDDKIIRFPIGVVKAYAQVIGKFHPTPQQDKKEGLFEGSGWTVEMEKGNYLANGYITSKGEIKDVKLLIGDREVVQAILKDIPLTDYIRHRLLGQPNKVKYSFDYRKVLTLRAGEDDYLDINNLPLSNGTLDFVLNDGEKEIRYPFFSWKTTKKSFNTVLPDSIPRITPAKLN